MKTKAAKNLQRGQRVMWKNDPTDLGVVLEQGYTGVGIDWDDGKRTWLDHDKMNNVSLAPSDSPAPPVQDDVIPLQIDLSGSDLCIIYLALGARSELYAKENGMERLAARALALANDFARIQKRNSPATVTEI